MHGVRPRRPRSRLESRLESGRHGVGALVNGSVSGINDRSVHVDAWIVCMVGSPSRCFVGGEVGSWKNTTVHRQSAQRRRLARGSSTNMVGVSLCLSSQGPKMAIEMGGPRLSLWFRSQSTAHLTSPVAHHPLSTRGPLLFADFLSPPAILRHCLPRYLTCSLPTAHLTHPSFILLARHVEVTAAKGHSHPRQRKNKRYFHPLAPCSCQLSGLVSSAPRDPPPSTAPRPHPPPLPQRRLQE